MSREIKFRHWFPSTKVMTAGEKQPESKTVDSPEGWEKDWEEVNHQLYNQGGVNPHAYRLGWLKTARERDTLAKENERMKEILSETEAVQNKTAVILKSQTIEMLKAELSRQKGLIDELVELLNDARGHLALNPSYPSKQVVIGKIDATLSRTQEHD